MNQLRPTLAPPGSGLPKLELLIARVRFAAKRRRTSRGEATAEFESEREQILKLVRACDAGTGSRRVLIKRPRGLEDSSRFWSVFMTLDHLRITNDVFTTVIQSLTAGIVPEFKASTAAVKPGEDVGIETVSAFDVELTTLPPGKINYPLHSHAAQTEHYIILSGSGLFRDDAAKEERLQAGDHLICHPGDAHQIENDGPDPLVYYVIADHHRADVSIYSRTGKRHLKPDYRVVTIQDADYYAGEE